MIRKTHLLLTLLVVQLSFCQAIEFGEVTKEELLEDVYEKDSSANAVVLYKNQNTYFGANTQAVELETILHERIKIYNKEGFDNATITMNLFKNGSTKERVSKIEAYTYNLEDGVVVKTKLDKDQIFDTEFSYNYNQIKFTMPNVKEGSVLDIQYKITSPFYFNIDEFRFQYDIPIKKLEAEIRTPKGYNFNPKSKGYINFYPKRSIKMDHRLGMNVDILNYKLQDVPALKDESFVDNINNHRSGVTFELVSVIIPGRANQYYAKTWGDVAKTIGNADDYKKQLDKSNSFDEILDSIISTKPNDIDKMKSVFKYVKNNIKWNGMDGKYFYKGIRKALKEQKGNAADVNLTLVAMLRYAGIDANPLIISTKDNLIPLFPTVDRLNYVLAYAVIAGKQYFLDATDEFSDINVLPLKDYNWKGVLVNNTKMEWKRVTLEKPDFGVSQYMIAASIDDEGVVEGNVKSRHTNHEAYMFRENFKNQNLDAFITNKEDLLENIEISNYKAKNTDDYEGYVSESFDFYKESGADIIDDKIYIQPLLLLKIKENPFKSEKREYPIDFGYPKKESYMINITFPEGYTIESSPEPIIVKIPNDLGFFKYIPKVLGNKIQLSVNLELNEAIVGAENYLFIKEFFNQMINKEKEQIVLTKS
jgi:hypothetical protein